MSALGIIGGVLQSVVVVAASPVLVGVMRQVRAKLEGRADAGIGQPWRDLRKLFGMERIAPRGTIEVFRFARLVLMATTLVVAVVAPPWRRWRTCSRWWRCARSRWRWRWRWSSRHCWWRSSPCRCG